jgi:hypothetical protein
VPYGTILAVASIVLAVLYGVDSEASVFGRVVAAMATLASFVLPGSIAGQVLSVLLRLAVSLFVLVRMNCSPPTAEVG